MDLIRQYDWFCSAPEPKYFISEEGLDNCITEKILRNKFTDPLISSESEDEEARKNINWDQIFKQKGKSSKYLQGYVPGLHPHILHPKLSALSQQQHYVLLKVLSALNPNVQKIGFFPRPMPSDERLFDELKETYEKEQNQFIEWAKKMWISGHNIRALRPKPAVESAYQAELRLRMAATSSLPTHYELAAQIPLHTERATCTLTRVKELVTVDMNELARVQFPDLSAGPVSIAREVPAPQPCPLHPTRFILPNESTPSTDSLSQVYRELGQFAVDNGAGCVASEGALRCLVQTERQWTLPVAVVSAVDAGGAAVCVPVLGNAAAARRAVRLRTERAYSHLLRAALVPATEKARVMGARRRPAEQTNEEPTAEPSAVAQDLEMTDEEDEDKLFIDMETASSTGDQERLKPQVDEDDSEVMCVVEQAEEEREQEKERQKEESDTNPNVSPKDRHQTSRQTDVTDIVTCTCEDSEPPPPPRSYAKWQLSNSKTNETFDIVVHCSHKTKDGSGEVLLEPIVEYQLDLGASELPADRRRSLAMALHLRENAAAMIVRVDGPNGNLICHSVERQSELLRSHAELLPAACNAACSALEQLQGLLPGSYLLTHDIAHGQNALLFVARPYRSGTQTMSLEIDESQPQDDDSASLKTPPVLTPALLPMHKHRKILPCAFTPYENLVERAHAKPEPLSGTQARRLHRARKRRAKRDA